MWVFGSNVGSVDGVLESGVLVGIFEEMMVGVLVGCVDLVSVGLWVCGPIVGTLDGVLESGLPVGIVEEMIVGLRDGKEVDVVIGVVDGK